MDDALIQMLRFGAKGYTCSQIMVLLALDKCMDDNPGLVRAMAGLAYGCGSGAATCGVLAGACCVIGYFAGKGTDDEQEKDILPLMLEEINEWFQNEIGQRYQGITCQSILGDADPQKSRNTCGRILAATYTQTMNILCDHGICFE